MTPPRRRARIKAEVAWFALGLFVAHLALDMVVDWRYPRLYDGEFGTRLKLLNEQVRQHPDRPLLAFLGSSRVASGFVPERLPPLTTPKGEQALPFNFAHLAGGPFTNLVQAERLLRFGLKPRWLVMEFMPSMFMGESPSMAVTHTGPGDLPLMCRYLPAWKAGGIYLRGRLNPWYKHRLRLLEEYAPAWTTYTSRKDMIPLQPLGGDDHWFQEVLVNPMERSQRIAVDRADMVPKFQHFHLDSFPDRAQRELLTLCRKEHVQPLLVLTPECSEYQTWYTAEAREQIGRYLDDLRREFGVPVIDARTWLPDEDFSDSHHPCLHGAEVFTDRLGREALQPLVSGVLSEEPGPALASVEAKK